MNTNDIQPKRFGRNGYLILIGILIAVTWLPITDHIADADIDAGFNRALVSFGIAKGLNMVISVLQSTQLSAQPLGIGIAMTPGELLDPINDLIEQFSNFMLLATVAFGIQKILISIGGHIFIKSLLSALGIAAAWYMLKDRPVPHFLKNALILVILVRLAVPVAAVVSNGAYQLFLEPQYQESKKELSESALQLDALKSSTQQFQATHPAEAPAPADAAPAAEATQDKPSLWSKVKTSVSDVVKKVTPSDFMQNVDTQIDGMSQQVQQIGERVTRNVVSQIVVFLLQTLFFPIGLIWVLYKLAVSLMYRRNG